MKRTLAALLFLAAPLACTKENHPPTPDASSTGKASAAAPSASDIAPDTVVAVVNGQNMTAHDLDTELKPQLDALNQEFADKRFKLREEGLDQVVIKKLVDAEAKKENLSEEDWMKKKIEGAVPEVSEAEAKKFFDENKDRLSPPGQPPPSFDEVKARLVPYLTNQKRAEFAQKLFEDLKSKANVQIKLEEPAVQVEAVGPAIGDPHAPVTIVEFSDFQCPYCSKVEPTIKRLMADYAGKIRFVFRDYPLPFHEHAQKAAEASHCAEAQDKYWAMHDAMFAHQEELDDAGLKKLAKENGIDSAKFDACLDKGEMKDKVDANAKAGQAVGVQGTPHFFINGHPVNGALPYEEFKKAVDKELAKVASK